jgi:transcriptional regulator with XRE-family HTH domain
MTLQEVQEERKRRSENMRNLRLSKGISQEKLAQISGLSWPTIVRIENGKKEWRIDSEIIYIKALNSLTDKILDVYR